MKAKRVLGLIWIVLSLCSFLEVLSPSVFAPSPILQIAVRTEQPFYAQGELVKISGNTTDGNGTPVSAASIALEVRDSGSNTVFLDIATTYTNGSFYDSFRLAIAAPSGPYTVYVTASKAGYAPGQNQTTFTVGSPTGMASAVWTKKATYMRYENATAYGKLLYNRTAVPNATITFLLICPNQTQWLTLINVTDATGMTTIDFNLPPTIPAGQYRVNASTYKEGYENSTATTIFAIQNQEPTIYQATINPQIVEKPDTIYMQTNVSDYEDNTSLNLMALIAFPNQTTQILNMTFNGSLYTLQCYIHSTHPSGTYQLTIRAIDKDAGSCDYKTNFEVVTPILKGSVCGWITNSTAQTIPNAPITLSLKIAYLTYTTESDSQGYFNFTKILPGQYDLIASASAYAIKTSSIEIVANSTTNQNVTLQHLPTLTGFITTQLGSPIPNASITVTNNQGQIGQSTTNSNGLYRMIVSTDGASTIMASAYGYSPNSTITTLTFDQAVFTNFSLIKNGKLVGIVTDALSQLTITNATVTLISSQYTESQKTNATGQFACNDVSPGTYTLVVNANNYLTNMTTVTIDSDQTINLQVQLTPTGNITGTVKEAAGNSPLQGVTVTLVDYRGVTIAAVHTNSTGGYLFYLVKAANYTLRVYAYGYNTTSTQVTVVAHMTAVSGFTLIPSAIYVTLKTSSGQFSRGETVTFAAGVTDTQGQSMADNVTRIEIVLSGPNNETRYLDCTRIGEYFEASYAISNAETMGTWTATAIVDDVFGNHGEAVERINILEPFLMQFSSDKTSYVSSDAVNFTAYVVRYGNLTRFLNSSEITASLDIRDSQNITIAALNLTSSGDALRGLLAAGSLQKGDYVAHLTIGDLQGNIKSLSASFRIVQDFQITISTNKDSYNRTETLYIHGAVTFTNGTSVASVMVALVVTVKNYPRTYYVTTNNSGIFEYSFTPLGIDSGNYTATGHTLIENIDRSNYTQFTILGLALNPSYCDIKMPENSANDFLIRILNTGETALTGISATITPPSIDGVTVTPIGNPQSNLAPNDWTTLTFRVTALEGATSFAEFNLTVRCSQDAIELGYIGINLFPATPILQVFPQLIDTSLAPEGFSTNTIAVKNVGYATLRNASLSNPSNPWISQTTSYLGDIDPQQTKQFDIVIHPPNSTNIGLYQDLMIITSDNHSPVIIYIFVKITTAENGTLIFRVVDDAGVPISSAKITLQYQECWLQAETKTTNTTGYCTFPSLTGGRYSYIVTTDNHGTASGVAIVQPASTVYVEVVSPLQAIAITFDVMPITIEDEYYIVLNMTFATDIPPPALIPLPPILTFGADRAQVYAAGYNGSMSFSLQNIGLISVFNVTIFVQEPLPDGYTIALGDFGERMQINEILGQSVTQIPCNLLVMPNRMIAELENGVIGKIKIEGYYTYFDDSQNAQQAKVAAEVLVRICDRGARRLCVNPPAIYGVNRNGVISFSPGAWPNRLDDVTITNCAYNESASVFTLAVGGGITFFVGIDILQMLTEPLNPFDVSFFLAYGVITRYGGIPGEAITLVDAENTFGMLSVDVSGGPIMSLLSYTFLTTAIGRGTIGSIELLPGESAILSSEMWDIPTSFADLFEDLLGFQVGIGTEITMGGILFAYKWKLDSIPSLYLIPIFIIDISAPSISIPVSAGPISDGGGGNGVPWQSWWGWSDSNVISPPTITYPTGPEIREPEQPPQSNIHEIVKLSISQEATLERDAFLATLQMTNRMPSTRIENVRVTLDITFINGSEAKQNFYYNTSNLENISAIDGTGLIESSATATVSWLIIPKANTGGNNDAGIYYAVQAHIFYTVSQTLYNLSSSIETIGVRPQPFLQLDYYLPQTVKADILFKLGIRVTNTGFGTARNFRIDSAQPVIYENLAHLLVDFTLVCSYVQGAEVQNSLRMVFGDIEPGGTRIGYWLMICSLDGTFTQFSSTCTHKNALGGDETSLATTDAYILMRDLSLEGNLSGFLIDFENNMIPDQIIDSSSGVSMDVAPAEYNITQSNQSSITIETQKNTYGWIWINLQDPFNNTREISLVQRADGKILDGQNYWMADNRINIVDDPEENYTIHFSSFTDIVIESISVYRSKTVVCQTQMLLLNVTIHNAGAETETVTLEIYANETLVITIGGISISASESQITSPMINASSLLRGNHTITAHIVPIPGETNTTNNDLTLGVITISMVGDIVVDSPDSVVDIFDIVVVALAFGSDPGQSNWNPNADINNDGIVDIFDIVVVALHFGETS